MYIIFNIHISFTINFAVTKRMWVMEKKLLTYLNSALKFLLELDIFPRVPQKNCCPVLLILII